MKTSFSSLEILFSVALMFLLGSYFIPKIQSSQLELAKKRVILYLQHARMLGLTDNRYNHQNDKWYKQIWSFRFRNCRQSVGGVYFVVHSDRNQQGGINQTECAKDPLTRRYLYSSNHCNSNQSNNAFVQLTKHYKVTKVAVSCNETSSIGMFAFGSDGSVYTSLATPPKKLFQTCVITLEDIQNNKEKIFVEPTGHIH